MRSASHHSSPFSIVVGSASLDSALGKRVQDLLRSWDEGRGLKVTTAENKWKTLERRRLVAEVMAAGVMLSCGACGGKRCPKGKDLGMGIEIRNSAAAGRKGKGPPAGQGQGQVDGEKCEEDGAGTTVRVSDQHDKETLHVTGKEWRHRGKRREGTTGGAVAGEQRSGRGERDGGKEAHVQGRSNGTTVVAGKELPTGLRSEDRWTEEPREF